MKKRLFILILTAALLGSLTACSTDTEADNVVPATEDIEATEQTDVVAELETETETEDIIPETEEPTEAVVPETEQAEEYTVTDMSVTKYAKSSVNVRKGPSSDYEKLGGLSTNQQVAVTGQADTGWYRIEYNGNVGFVSDKYLVDNKVAVNTNTSNNTTSQSTQTSTTTTDTANTSTSSGTNTSTPATGGDTGNSGYVDNSNTSASTPATSTPAVDNSTPASTSTTDTSASTPTTSVDASGMTVDDLNAMFGVTDAIGTGGGEDVGIGGDWIE